MKRATVTILAAGLLAVSGYGNMEVAETTTGSTDGNGSRVKLIHDQENGLVEVRLGGEPFTTFHYGEAARTPYFWPVFGEGGVGVTRNYPMGEDDPASDDHPHHRSLWLTFGAVNGHDFWHHERIMTTEVNIGVRDGYGWLRAKNQWQNPEDETVLDEVQEWRFYDNASSDYRFIEVITTLHASHGDVTFDDDKEGFLAVRVRPEIQGDRNGTLANARGESGERAVYGAPVRWMDYSGDIAGVGRRGVALFDHPENFRAGYWHVRDYGLMAVNPFGSRTVGGLDEDGRYVLARGESLTLRYGVAVHSGADVATLDRWHREWAE